MPPTMMRLVLFALLAALVQARPEEMLGRIAGKLSLHDTKMGQMQELNNRMNKVNTHDTRERHPDIDLTTPEMIIRRGYPAEIHYVTTADHYILQMHRIPNPGKPVVFLQHGLLCASSDWVMMGPELGLAYIMFEAGYDVWMGNARGNTYSRNHTFLNPDKDSEFWKFTWHHKGVYDVPAELDYVLGLTGEQQVIYMGHSMGTTMFWIMCSEKPKYNAKIKQMHALAPVAFMGQVESPLRLMAPFVMEVEWILGMMGMDEFLPSSEFFELMGAALCRDQAMFQIVCSNILFLIAGFDSQQLNETALPVIMDHTPAGASTKTICHYAQEINSWNFEYYDFGYFDNEDMYGNRDPPDYPLEKITAPVYLHWSDNDWLAYPDDVATLYSRLSNGKASIRVPLDAFNHLDFLWAVDVRTLLYDTILALVENPLP
ncbi:hypothetical protein B566_EDAN002292 [Ephemera danica]|nr:hypothetical protein B566_EDAN002292 [Ephemera danica]